MSAVATELGKFLKRYIPLIEEELFSFLQVQEPEDFMYRPMRDYPERGGKRSRPALVLLSCQALGGDINTAFRTAAAFEMFQSFALLHDDIEDDSELRRGKPCVHRLLGVPLSINVGDALYAKVFEMLSANVDILGYEKTLKLIVQMTQGSCETFEGQAYDVGWIRQRYVPTEAEFMTMLRKKTGWYTGRGPCTAGAVIAGCSDEMRRAIGDFGEAMAVAFQIRDDLLNLLSSVQDETLAPGVTEGAYGKERGGDIAEGKRTLIIIHLLKRRGQAERGEVLRILHSDRNDTSQQEIDLVIGLAEEYGAVAYAEQTGEAIAKESLTHLESLPAGPCRDRLKEMLEFFVQRSF